jgi:hypothetical protein
LIVSLPFLGDHLSVPSSCDSIAEPAAGPDPGTPRLGFTNWRTGAFRTAILEESPAATEP